MSLAVKARNGLLSCLLITGLASPTWAAAAGAQNSPSSQRVRIVGQVRDQANAIALPGVPVEVVGSDQVVYTDVDGRFSLEVAPGTHQLKVMLDGYQEQMVTVEARATERTTTADIGLSMTRFAETVTVVAAAPLDAITSTAAAQLVVRRMAPVISDNVGAVEMKANGDSDAAGAMSRVTGLSVVDNQYVYVRGLGERYSNTTLSGSVLPTTEPDKKVVPLDLFPAGLLDSVQVAKSYLPDRSADFAGGLVQIQPLKFPNQSVFDLSFGLNHYETSTGKSIPLSPLGSRDFWGFDNGSRALPSSFPAGKIVRRGIYTPEVGFPANEITAFGRALDNRWQPVEKDGRLGQSWGGTYGSRFGKLGVVASVNHSYKEQYVEENRKFFILDNTGDLDVFSDYDFQIGSQKAQLGALANLAYAFTPNHRLSFENFYSHSGKDEGRIFEGENTDANFIYRDYRLQYVEEGLISNGLSGDHFFPGLANSKIDWRVTSARASRDEPDIRETLYLRSNVIATDVFRLADNTQSGFRMFNTLDDETVDVAANWSAYMSPAGRPLQLKFGPSYVKRTREFSSRRFRFIPTNARAINLQRSPEELLAAENVGVDFRLNEDTRPTDAYDAEAETVAFYGMTDVSLSARARLVGGVRVEKFKQTVSTFDPFGLFVDTIASELDNTDIFPGVNFVYAARPNMNVRFGYSQTVNRPEFRELSPFEFTDIIGSRAVRGNPNLTRALIRSLDARWEVFTGARNVWAASVFLKNFEDPIERVIIAGAQPIATFQNADSARNVGLELEAGQRLSRNLFISANYTFVDSEIRLTEEARSVQTSLVRPLAGQSKNLLNLMAEFTAGSFSTRVLYNFFGDRISDVGANDTPDIIEDGRGTLDVIVSQRLANRLSLRINLENLTNADYTYLQGTQAQRTYNLGRTVAVSVGFSLF
jgi:outer membrane receptor protein involved in Fe transport